jgi:hypothetical protein
MHQSNPWPPWLIICARKGGRKIATECADVYLCCSSDIPPACLGIMGALWAPRVDLPTSSRMEGARPGEGGRGSSKAAGCTRPGEELGLAD